jgi:hypothetical protein
MHQDSGARHECARPTTVGVTHMPRRFATRGLNALTTNREKSRPSGRQQKLHAHLPNGAHLASDQVRT